MLLEEAKKILSDEGFVLEESSFVTVPSVVSYISKKFDFEPTTVTIQGNDVTVFDAGEYFLKIVEGEDGAVYLTFLNDAGVPNGERSVKITSLEDIDAAL